MNLDKRIIDIKKVMDCFTTEDAKQYMNTSGYFAYNLDDFADLTTCYEGTLVGICDNIPKPYLNKNKELSNNFRFFLPEKFVMRNEKKEKKYRPYTLEEFQQNFTMGLSIRYRNKIDKLEKLLLYVGYERCVSDVIIIVGDNHYTLDELFNHYEVYDRYGNWVPFGVGE